MASDGKKNGGHDWARGSHEPTRSSSASKNSARKADRSSADYKRSTADAEKSAQHRAARRSNVIKFNRQRTSEQQTVDLKKVRHAPDYVLLTCLIVLVLFGILMVYSSSYYSQEVKFGESSRLFIKQIICAGLGMAAIIALMLIDYHKLVKLRIPILAASIIILLAVFVPGIGDTTHGSTRWINIAGISIQPSELVKAGLIIFIGCQIGKDPRPLKTLRGFMPYMVLIVAICIPIIFQPNFSAVICICLLVFSMLLVGGAQIKHIVLTFLIGGVGGLSALAVAEPYRIARLIAFTDPWSDSTTAAYQLRQSLYAIASGGLFGRGLGNSMQKLQYLPFSESDFIFAIVVEELGFIGAAAILAVFGVMIYRGVKIAMRAPDLTGCLLCTGVTAIIAIQVIVNVAVVTGCMPPTGVVLPFISYGGSSLSVFMALVGLQLCISRYTVKMVRIKTVVTDEEKTHNI